MLSMKDGGPPMIAAAVPLIIAAFIARTFRSLVYVIEGDVLIVKSGLVRWRIKIHNIEDITPTRSAASAPALSLDRLRIAYWHDGARRELLVSPENKGAFVEALRAVKPGIRYHPGTHAHP